MLATVFESELHFIEEDHNFKHGVCILNSSGSRFENCLGTRKLYNLKDTAMISLTLQVICDCN